MFTKRWPGRIIFDKEFEVQIVGRGSIIYKEGEKKLNVASEWLESTHHYWIISDSIRKWEPPFDNELVDYNKKVQIIENIKKALSHINASVDIDNT
ncbi:MAG: hypothetical protein EHM45_14265 [Desulfobacteraceae bacterium]|nr:MAG: hypothetical protein EHM45_14265 [Desulfobacteraceae bacterium]